MPIVVNVFAKFKEDPSILMVIDSSETSSSGAHLLKAFQEECLKKFKGPVKFHQITFHETESVLGTTWDLLILDLMEQLRPNDLGRLIELVRGGGLIAVAAPPLDQWPNITTRFQKRLLVPPYTEKDLRRLFIRRLIRKLREHPGIIIAFSNSEVWGPLSAQRPPLHPPPTIPSSSIFPKELYAMALTHDQVRALQALEELLLPSGTQKKQILLITANRGRGKSAALGLALAGLLQEMESRKKEVSILLTAPSPENVQTVFEFAALALKKLGVRHEVTKSDAGAIVGMRARKGAIKYLNPYLASRAHASIAIVDEAAGIPVPLLFKIAKNFKRAVFSSTIHGYEGAGRGFGLRFVKSLKESPDVRVIHVEMKEPIRYSENDPIEQWLYDTLLLDAEPSPITEEEKQNLTPENCVFKIPDMEQWFLEQDNMLRQFIGIYVLAHYRNRPDDLAILGDAPHHKARYLESLTGKVVVALHIAEEGRIPEEELKEILLTGGPPGNVIPSCVVKYFPLFKHFIKLRGFRVVRIATHPELMDRGLGSQALALLVDEAAKSKLDWVGAGFGASEQLLRFWIKNGFYPIHISPSRNPVSGEFTVIVVKPVSRKAKQLLFAVNREFKLKFLDSLYDTYFSLEPEIARLLLSPLPVNYAPPHGMTNSQWSRLLVYINGGVTYEGACDAVRGLLKLHFLSSGRKRLELPPEEERALIAKALQGKTWKSAANLSGISPGTIKSRFREIIRRMVLFYAPKKVFTLL